MAKNYRHLVKTQVQLAGIPYSERQRSEHMILEALRNLRATKKTASHLYCPMSRSPIRARPSYSTAGRPRLEAEATYIISVLRYVWSKAKGKKPTANRRGDPDSPFVQFAEPILHSIGIFNTLDNLSRYSTSSKSLRI